MNARSTPGWVALLLTALPGCSGSLGGSLGPGGEPAEDTASAPVGSAPLQTSSFRPAAVALRKLSVLQYQNTVADLVGLRVALPELEPDTAINGFVSIGAAKTTISPSGVEKFESAAFAVAAAALAAEHRHAFVGCTTEDAACAQSFLARFGQRAFRRPLSSDEQARYAGLASQAEAALGDFYQGLEYAVAGILQSPSFLFRVELGQDVGGGKVALDDYELATRLSYLLWNTTPDDALLDAASKGQLRDALQPQAERLLADPRAKAALDNFHSERLGLDELEATDKSATVMPGGLDDALKAAMKHDVLATIEEHTFGTDQDFRDLFTTRVAFVNGGLAQLYGLPATSAGRVDLPNDGPRAGLLGKAAFLATYAHSASTSPTKRGKFIRERLLCQSIPAPPPDVNTALPEIDGNAVTMRDRLAAHSTVPSCAACHKLMDPMGLSLEHFDAVGRFRQDDQGHAIDASGALNGQSFDGPVELGELLHDEPSASACVARQVYRYATGHGEGDGEEPAVKATVAAFAASGYHFDALLRAVIASDGFRYGAKE